MTKRTVREPVDPQPLAKTVSLALRVYIAAEAATVVVSALEIGRLMKGPAVASPGAELVIGVVWLAYLLTYFVTAFLTLKWIYRANLNASVLDASKKISPAWSVGWFFVPFANLVMPFRAMRETWRISQSSTASKETPERVSFWWGLWVLASLAGGVSSRLELAAEDIGPLLLSLELSIVSSCAAIPAALLLRSIVGEITEAQAAALGSTPQIGPEAPAAVSG